MKRFAILFSAFLLTLFLSNEALAQVKASYEPNNVIGLWLSENGNEKIEIYRKGDLYHGTMVWMAEEYDEQGNLKIDNKNPNPSLRTRPMVGIDILYNFKYAGNG
ncbi:MAG: DUF2147 domain-containing protein, partial [Bacteroidota bacterium]